MYVSPRCGNRSSAGVALRAELTETGTGGTAETKPHLNKLQASPRKKRRHRSDILVVTTRVNVSISRYSHKHNMKHQLTRTKVLFSKFLS